METGLNFSEQGTGFPLFLLHGNGEDSSYFEHQTGFFAQKYRVIAVDTRGHGKSPRGDAPFTFPQFAEDLHNLMEKLQIEKAHILGFSDGGNIALTFALAYPEMVGKLILNGANLNPWGVRLGAQIPIVCTYWLLCAVSVFDQKARPKKELFHLMVHQPHIDPEGLKNLNIPTLVIAGERDMIAEKHTRLIAASLPDAELKILPGDHFLAGRNPEMFNREVAVFLEKTE